MFTMNYHTKGNHRSEWCHHGPYTAKGNMLYLLVTVWAGNELTVGGIECNVKKVVLLDTGKEKPFEQEASSGTAKEEPFTCHGQVCPQCNFVVFLLVLNILSCIVPLLSIEYFFAHVNSGWNFYAVEGDEVMNLHIRCRL